MDEPLNFLLGAVMLLPFFGGMGCIVLLCFGRRTEGIRRGAGVGLALCLVAILIMVTMASPTVGPHVSERGRTVGFMMAINMAFVTYETEYGVSPPAKDQPGFIKNLLSDNPRRIAFINLKSNQMNAQGQVLDSWGTPFCITVLDSKDLQIFSAGPDKIWQTPDDLSLDDP